METETKPPTPVKSHSPSIPPSGPALVVRIGKLAVWGASSAISELQNEGKSARPSLLENLSSTSLSVGFGIVRCYRIFLFIVNGQSLGTFHHKALRNSVGVTPTTRWKTCANALGLVQPTSSAISIRRACPCAKGSVCES